MTFSIVARDTKKGEWGIAVQSRFLAVGAVVPLAKVGVGAIATQAWANTGLSRSGDYQGEINSSYDEAIRDAFRSYSGRENLEERWFEDTRTNRVVLEFMRTNIKRGEQGPG